MDEAIAAFRAIVEIAPTNLAVMHNLAGALGDADRHKEAIDWAQRAINAGIQAPETWRVLGKALAGDERLEEAKQAFQRAIELRPNDAVVQKDYAQLIWMMTADRALALVKINSAIAAFPQDMELRMVRAQIIGQTGDARGEYEEILAFTKMCADFNLHLEMATLNAALAAGEFIAALRHARAAYAKEPHNPLIRQALCRSLLAVGEPLEALREIGRLRAQYPLDQLYIALQATAWRMLEDERYHAVFDYKRFVAGFPLACPPGWRSAEQYVDDLIEALDRHHHYKSHPFGQSVRNGSQLQSLNAHADPAIRAVTEAVRGPIQSYIDQLGVGTDPLRIRNRGGYRLFSIWSIALKSSGYHVDHVDPQGWLSSACHLRFPEPKTENDKSGWLKFGEPGIPTTPSLDPELFVRPQKGVMVVFPSYMWHGTAPFSAATTRLTIAGDSLPAQPI